MKQTRAIVITGNGTNCEMEAAHACRLGGFDEAVIAHIAEILSGEIRLDDFHFLNLTGGFLDGDDLGSAKAQANRLKTCQRCRHGMKNWSNSLPGLLLTAS